LIFIGLRFESNYVNLIYYRTIDEADILIIGKLIRLKQPINY
jgi:hypothetical protein